MNTYHLSNKACDNITINKIIPDHALLIQNVKGRNL
jgi:hypothetical protein